MVKKLRKKVIGLTKANVGIGVGAVALGGISAKSPVSVMGGMSAMTGFMPIVSTGVMAGETLRLVKTGYKVPKKSKRR